MATTLTFEDYLQQKYNGNYPAFCLDKLALLLPVITTNDGYLLWPDVHSALEALEVGSNG